jgi:hypothetical protein
MLLTPGLGLRNKGTVRMDVADCEHISYFF